MYIGHLIGGNIKYFSNNFVITDDGTTIIQNALENIGLSETLEWYLRHQKSLKRFSLNKPPMTGVLEGGIFRYV